MMIKICKIAVILQSALALVVSASAQIGGSGWLPQNVTFNVQWPYNVPENTRYWFTNGIYHCLTYSNDAPFSEGNTTLPRTEQRFTPDYTAGEIQYQSMEMAPSNENSYCVFQIHTGDAESPTYGSTAFMLFWFTNSGGSVHDYSGTTLATNLANQWFQLNVDHNLVTHTIRVWINQNLVWTQTDNGANDFYFKDGVYEQSHGPSYQMDTYVKNLQIWTNSGVGTPLPTVYWTNTATGAPQNWNLNANWTNSATFPNGPGVQAVIAAKIVQPQTISLDQPITVSSLAIGAGSGAAAYTIAANGGSLTFSSTNTMTLTELSSSRGDVLATAVSITTNLAVVNNSTHPLTLAGTLSSSGGALILDSGVLQVGDGTTNGSLGQVNVLNDSALIFNRSDALTNSGVISGSGSIAQMGTGNLTLSGANTFSGGATISGGTLKMGNSSALGGANGAVAVTNEGTLDLNGNNLGAEPITVSGWGVNSNGALISTSSSAQDDALQQVTLAGDTAIGGPGNWLASGNPGRWDIRGSGTTLTMSGGQPFNLYKTGSNQVSFVGVTMDTNLATIDIKQGLLGFEDGSTSMGNPAASLIVRAGATLEFYQSSAPVNSFTKQFVLFGNGLTATITNWPGGGSSTISGQMTLNGTCIIGVNGTSFTNNCNLVGTGSLTKSGPQPLTMGGTNTYTGNTTVNAGYLILSGQGSISGSSNITVNAGATLDASARNDATLTLNQGQELTGTGAVKGNVIIGNGAMLAPGSSIGTLTFSNNLTLNGGSTTVMEINKSVIPSNDLVQVAGNLACGGTLVLTNAGSIPFFAGDSFKLFSASNIYGAFTNITPAIPGLNLAWNTSLLAVNGTLSVVNAATPSPVFTVVASGATGLVLGGANGVPGWRYYVLSSADLSLPLNDWTCVSTNTFAPDGSFSFTNVIVPGSPGDFYMIQLAP